MSCYSFFNLDSHCAKHWWHRWWNTPNITKSRHTVTSVSAAKKTKDNMYHTSVLFTGSIRFLNSAFRIFKITTPISNEFIHFLPYIYTTSHIKFEINRFSSSQKICSRKLSNFLYTCLLLWTKLQIHLSRVKITFSYFHFFQISNTNNAHLGLHFLKVLRNSKKDWGSYICTMISYF